MARPSNPAPLGRVEATRQRRRSGGPPGKLTRETAGVIGRPPRILIVFVFVGVVLDLVIPAPFLPGGIQIVLSAILLPAGLGLFVWACLTMVRAETNIPTSKPALRIVRNGPYRLSRNPIYLSMAVTFLGIAVAVDGPWLLVLLPIWVAVIEWGVIRREERYLARRFGADYDVYRSRVRRWI